MAANLPRTTRSKAAAAGLLEIYRRLERTYDLDRWHWRTDTPAVDICVGAILVQHTAWSNVEKAVVNLRAAGCLSIEGLCERGTDEIATLVRPAGMPLRKARRLKNFAAAAADGGGLEAYLGQAPSTLRELLLATHGIGPETADVILLYAAGAAVTVHDAYTARLLRRIGTGPAKDSYHAWAEWQDELLPPDLIARKRFHAAVVVHCKETCRSVPRCPACPLGDICAYGQNRSERNAAVES